MGYGLLCGLWVWRRRTNSRPCCPPMSNPSTSPWTAWLDSSGWWDNWMAAQHLSWDLVQPSSGFNNSPKRRAQRIIIGTQLELQEIEGGLLYRRLQILSKLSWLHWYKSCGYYIIIPTNYSSVLFKSLHYYRPGLIILTRK